MPLDKSVQSAWKSVAASQTDSVVVAAGAANQKIRVLGAVLNHGDTTASSVTFNTKPSGAGTAISPALKAAANGVIVMPPIGNWLETNAGEGLSVTTGAGSATGILVSYTLVAV